VPTVRVVGASLLAALVVAVVPSIASAAVACPAEDSGQCQSIVETIEEESNALHRDLWVLIGAIITAPLIPAFVRAVTK